MYVGLQKRVKFEVLISLSSFFAITMVPLQPPKLSANAHSYTLCHSEHEKCGRNGLIFRAWPCVLPFLPHLPHPNMKNVASLAAFLMFVFLFSPSPILCVNNAAEMASFFVLGLYFPPSPPLSSKQKCGQTGCIFCVVFLSCPSPTSVLCLEYYLYT